MGGIRSKFAKDILLAAADRDRVGAEQWGGLESGHKKSAARRRFSRLIKLQTRYKNEQTLIYPAEIDEMGVDAFKVWRKTFSGWKVGLSGLLRGWKAGTKKAPLGGAFLDLSNYKLDTKMNKTLIYPAKIDEVAGDTFKVWRKSFRLGG